MKFPKAGDILKFKSSEGKFYPHFTDMVEFAQSNLIPEKEYKVVGARVNSSWCSVVLEDFPDQKFNYAMFYALG
jgi:hypothetical protein